MVNPPTQRHRATLVPSRLSAWLVTFYIGLGFVTGATSFNRRFPVTTAADYQRQAWQDLSTRTSSSETNRSWYARRALMPSLTACLVACGLSWPQAFALLRLVSVIATYLTFHGYLRLWLDDARSMVGTLFMAATLPLTFQEWWEVPTDFTEILAFTLAMRWVVLARFAHLVPLTLLAALNRETALYIPFLPLLTAPSWAALRRRIPWALLAFAAYLLAAGATWWWVGKPHPGQWANAPFHASEGFTQALVKLNPYNNFLFYGYLFGPFWVFPLLRWRAVPEVLQRALLVAPLHLIIAFLGTGGRVDEARHLCTLYPIIVPAAVIALFSAQLSSRNELRDEEAPNP
jgi:hypothetical protein